MKLLQYVRISLSVCPSLFSRAEIESNPALGGEKLNRVSLLPRNPLKDGMIRRMFCYVCLSLLFYLHTLDFSTIRFFKKLFPSKGFFFSSKRKYYNYFS